MNLFKNGKVLWRGFESPTIFGADCVFEMLLVKEQIPILYNSIKIAEVSFDILELPQMCLRPDYAPMLAGKWILCNTMDFVTRATTKPRISRWVKSAKLPDAYVVIGITRKSLMAPPFSVGNVAAHVSGSISHLTFIHQCALPSLLRTTHVSKFIVEHWTLGNVFYHRLCEWAATTPTPCITETPPAPVKRKHTKDVHGLQWSSYSRGIVRDMLNVPAPKKACRGTGKEGTTADFV